MDIDHTAAQEWESRVAALAQQARSTAEGLGSPEFSGSCAGRDYTELGDALAAALGGLRVRMLDRAQFIGDVGARIGDSSRAIADIDRELADRMRAAIRGGPELES